MIIYHYTYSILVYVTYVCMLHISFMYIVVKDTVLPYVMGA